MLAAQATPVEQDSVQAQVQRSAWSWAGLFGHQERPAGVDADWAVTCCPGYVAVTCPKMGAPFLIVLVFSFQVPHFAWL